MGVKHHTQEKKLEILERVAQGVSVGALAKKNKMAAATIYKWIRDAKSNDVKVTVVKKTQGTPNIDEAIAQLMEDFKDKMYKLFMLKLTNNMTGM